MKRSEKRRELERGAACVGGVLQDLARVDGSRVVLTFEPDSVSMRLESLSDPTHVEGTAPTLLGAMTWVFELRAEVLAQLERERELK